MLPPSSHSSSPPFLLPFSILILCTISSLSAAATTTTCPYDIDAASALIPVSCYPNYTNTADAPTTNCCTFVFAAYIFAVIRYSNISGLAFLPEPSASACATSFASTLIRRGIVRSSLLLIGDRCNLNADPAQFSAGKRPCQYPTVASISSAVDLSRAIQRCTQRDLSTNQSHCTSCQNSVIGATLTLLNVTKSKEFVPCGMATTIGIWSTSPDIRRFRFYALCMIEVLDNVGSLGTSSLIPSPPPPPPPPLQTTPSVTQPPSKSRLVLVVTVSTVGGVAVIAAILILYCTFCQGKTPTTISFSGGTLKTQAGSESPLPKDGLYIFTKSELKQATKDFDLKLVLGEGGAGKVYLGKLPSGQHVAIKRIYQKKKLDQFYREIEILVKLRHRNLTTLLGYCLDKKEHVLVYEYMAGGNLSRALYHGELTWRRRVEIAVDIAEGLAYLHEFSEGAVVHRDVKPTNILLSESGQAKLSDFGVSKILPSENSHVSTEIKGTTGYLDPEYFSVGQVSEAADVYSFGIVLLELITGKKAVVNTPTGGAESIVYTAHMLMSGGEAEPDVVRIADPRLGSRFEPGLMVEVFKMAYRCVKPYKSERPAMKEVLELLKRVLAEMEVVAPLPPAEEIVNDGLSGPSTSQCSTPTMNPWSL
ncbi:PREDICTED: probable LRR receptor-like serine/threonine-protein kinase At5g48740 [Nelumbo nucifera]|uniref:Protein kinase domain-containing protein n=2 Tax=Nelumbo nucifera TaxID=4432 RepID=A0A822Z1H1_NELNU|nr:PREDICTED: probable LRR receptor-like serine/threonine-protein kinase At5g48740 [Nelumbo nucifera]DAD38540.1 TPA_asm: hypothetical protein HUJ06_012862 [Nelumbo nucifera]